jgi:hypothetical protein
MHLILLKTWNNWSLMLKFGRNIARTASARSGCFKALKIQVTIPGYDGV